jgi:hypothetical protein
MADLQCCTCSSRGYSAYCNYNNTVSRFVAATVPALSQCLLALPTRDIIYRIFKLWAFIIIAIIIIIVIIIIIYGPWNCSHILWPFQQRQFHVTSFLSKSQYAGLERGSIQDSNCGTFYLALQLWYIVWVHLSLLRRSILRSLLKR